MRVNFIRLIFRTLCIMPFILTACDTDENHSFASYVDSITAKVQDGNSLRVDLNIHFLRSAFYQIEYWDVKDERKKKRTTVREGNGLTTCTLVLLKPETTYAFQVLINGKESVLSGIYQFETLSLPSMVPDCYIEFDELEDIDGYMILSRFDLKPGLTTIIDMQGNTVWYQEMEEKGVSVAAFDTLHHTVQCIMGGQSGYAYSGSDIIVMDLFGNILLQKDVRDYGLHHEIRRMPDGNLLMVNHVYRDFDLSAVGGSTHETVVGDGVVIMDMQGNIVWNWECFSEIDPREDEDIMTANVGPGDWVHANSANYDEDGNIYVTFNWLNQIWKINRETKEIEYRLGEDGTIDLNPEGWVSGVHNVNVTGPDSFYLFDNGTLSHQSRILGYKVDKSIGKAVIDFNVLLPTDKSSQFQGGVNILNSNLMIVCSTFSNAILFIDKSGQIHRIIRTPYQSYRAEYIPPFEY